MIQVDMEPFGLHFLFQIDRDQIFLKLEFM